MWLTYETIAFTRSKVACVQTSLCILLHGYQANVRDSAALDLNFNFFTSSTTVGFSSEDNCCQLQKLEKLIKDMHIKGILSIGFWQRSLSQITADKPISKQHFCQNAFLYFLICSPNHARNLGVQLICECGLYTSFYGISFPMYLISLIRLKLYG